ncbi:MAG: alcohol dehydrogenase catalytic domain-containing protein [Trueperaceae bacterium]
MPEPGPGEVRVRVAAVGICGSELSGYLGHNALRVPPLVMGHEFTGVVDAVGPTGDSSEAGAGGRTAVLPAIGARVVVNPLVSCGACEHCRSGRANLCVTRALIGAHRPGAFADAVVVPAASCLELPDDVGFVMASLVEPLACAVRATRLAGVDEESRVRVLGAGPIGLLCALVAREAGAREVTIHDPNRARAAVAVSWGLDAPEGGPEPGDAVIDAVGLEVTRRQAVAALERGGTAVFVGLHEPSAAFDGNDLVRDEKVVRGCFAYAPDDFARALTLLTSGLLPEPGPWLSVRDLADGQAAFDELIDTKPSVVKIVLRPEGAAEEV